MLKIINDLKRRVEFNKLVKESIFDVKNNSLYTQNISKIPECFAERKLATPNKEFLNRIITAYNLASKEQGNQSSAYQVGNEWLPIYNLYMNSIKEVFINKDVDKLNEIYENFLRETCSIGLHGLPLNMFKNFFNKRTISTLNKEVYTFDCVFMYLCWQKLNAPKEFNATELQMPDFGNAYGFFIDEKFVRIGAVYFHYYATKISEMIADSKTKTVVEIGAGYGGLPYFLKKMNQDLTYINFDLPENMALSTYYLMCCYPNKKFLLYGEANLDEVNIGDYDFIIMPNFEINKMKAKTADLVFNSYSLAEMSTETINTYIKAIMHFCKKHFMHVNHTTNSLSYSADDFGVDLNQFDLISKNKALWAFGRTRLSDEFEYIYTRK